MKTIIVFLAGIAVIFVYVAISIKLEIKYPKNERHSRQICALQHRQIVFLLNTFIKKNSGMIPADFQELMPMDYLNRKILLCPSQFTVADKAGFLEENSPVYISSYQLMVPRQRFDELNNGTVIVKEYEGNHPESVVDKKYFSSGYHVIVKDGNELKIDFVNCPPSKELDVNE